MIFPEFLTHQADGEIVITGHRITIVNVLDYYNDGYSVEMIKAMLPTISLSTLHKTIAFYLDNRAELDAYLKQYHADLAAARAKGSFTPSLEELERRLAERRAAEAHSKSA
jgi:uncharacterized protein (DUF433 family)